MNLDELRSVQRTERESSQLQHLRDSFYQDVAAYLEDRKATYREEMATADDPFAASEDLGHLKDEVESAQDVVEALYERRVGKVVKQAAFAAAGMATEEEGMTAEERELFEDLVERIRGNRSRVLGTLSGDGDAAPADEDGSSAVGDVSPPESPDRVADADADAAPDTQADRADDPQTPDEPPVPPADDVLSEAMGGADADPATGGGAAGRPTAPESLAADDADAAANGGSPSGPAGAAATDQSGPARDGDAPEAAAPAATVGEGGTDPDAGDADRVLVRITRDVGEIFGVDQRSYDLAAEDVVTLPTANADPLVERDAAERLE